MTKIHSLHVNLIPVAAPQDRDHDQRHERCIELNNDQDHNVLNLYLV